MPCSCVAALLLLAAGRGAGAIARPWRAGARAGDLARRQRTRSPAASTPRRSAGRSTRNVAEQVLRFHDGAVNAVAFLKDGRIATGGADAHIAIWTPGKPEPDAVLDGHSGADRRARGVARRHDARLGVMGSHACGCGRSPAARRACSKAHAQNVNGVAFSPDGTRAGQRRLRRDAAHLAARATASSIVRNLPTPLNAVAVAPDGEIVAAGADGKVYFLSPQGELRGEVEAAPTPVIALAISPDGKLVAAAGIRGSVAIIERKTRKLARTLVGPGLPVWSVAFFPDNRTLLTGGADRMIRRWDAVTRRADRLGRGRRAGGSARRLCRRSRRRGVPRLRRLPHAVARRGQQGRARRLAGIFGRRIATLPGYNFSAGAQEARHRVDAGDGGENVRDRADAPTRPAPRCRSRPSARPTTARRWWIFSGEATAK